MVKINLFVVVIVMIVKSSLALGQGSSGYEVLDTPINQGESNKIEVVEFFNYGCPHCFALEPLLHSWEQDNVDRVVVTREAPPLNDFWLPRSQAFYAAQVLDIADKLHQPMFDAIHIEGNKLRSPKAILEFVESQGVDRKSFQTAMNSDAVKEKIDSAMMLAKSVHITGVPTLLVAGKYVTGTRLAGGHEEVTAVLDELLVLEEKH